MNRLYQPELQRYEQSLDELLKGQSLYPMEGNYLDVSMPPEAIGAGVMQKLKDREAENNQRVFGNRSMGRYEEDHSKSARTRREMGQWFSDMIKPK